MANPAFADIGACVFDAYGTLFDVHSAVGRSGGALGDKAGPVSAPGRQEQLECTWLRGRIGADVDLWQIAGGGRDPALAANGIEDPELRQRLMDLYLSLDAYPEAAASLDRLRAGGQKAAILSNGAPGLLQAAVGSADLGSRLDAALSVDELAVFKPDPRVYQFAVDRLGVEAGRICFVSTNGWDAAGAAHFGFKVAWLNRFGQQPERLPGAPSAVIETLAEVPDLLGL